MLYNTKIKARHAHREKKEEIKFNVIKALEAFGKMATSTTVERDRIKCYVVI